MEALVPEHQPIFRQLQLLEPNFRKIEPYCQECKKNATHYHPSRHLTCLNCFPTWGHKELVSLKLLNNMFAEECLYLENSPAVDQINLEVDNLIKEIQNYRRLAIQSLPSVLKAADISSKLLARLLKGKQDILNEKQTAGYTQLYEVWIFMNSEHDSAGQVDKNILERIWKDLNNMRLTVIKNMPPSDQLNLIGPSQILPFIQKDAPKEIFKRKLQNFCLSPTQIEKIIKLFVKGRVNPLQKCLIDSFGIVIGNHLLKEFQQYIEVKKNQPEPQSKYMGTDQRSGHKIYQYKPSQRTLNIQIKRILIVGQTCGKSTFLNALVNYLMDVEVDDEFRYKIIFQDDQYNQQISRYKINCMSRPYDLQLIDTPGFADTSDLQKDDEIMKKMHCLFKEKIDFLHAVCFVIKSSMFRITAKTQYIFQKILQHFGKDVAKNIIFVLDGDGILQIQAVKSFLIKRYIQKINGDPFIKFNNSAIFQSKKVNKDIEAQWKIGITCFDNLMTKLNILQPCSLSLSKQVLSIREGIRNNILLLRVQLDNQLMKRNVIQKELCTILQYVDQINANATFKLQVDQERFQKIPTTYLNTFCLECSYICHQGKQKCQLMMPNGKCPMCPKKCVYNIHISVPYIIKWSTRKKMIIH